MLSLIICSRKAHISKELKENINQTIGTKYELIIIDNSNNQYSIFTAYNLGVKRAKYSILCFLHEDIVFHSTNWGQKALNHFKDNKCGIIGVAGNHYMSKLPGSHWSSRITSYNIIQSANNSTKTCKWEFQNSTKKYLSAVSIDGMWFCIPKNLFSIISFDEITFKDFHCYDLDICMQIKKSNYDVRVIFDILIEHKSLGNRDIIWLKNIFKAFHKWKKLLPAESLEISFEKKVHGNFNTAKELLKQISKNKASKSLIIQVWYYYLLSKPLINRKKIRYIKQLIKIQLCNNK